MLKYKLVVYDKKSKQKDDWTRKYHTLKQALAYGRRILATANKVCWIELK